MLNQSLPPQISVIYSSFFRFVFVLFISFFVIFFPSQSIEKSASATTLTESLVQMSRHGQDMETFNILRKSRGCLGFFWEKCDLSGSKLANFDLEGANLEQLTIPYVHLRHVNLTKAILINSELSYTDMQDVNLTQANLTGAKLIGANLQRVNLQGANLTNADLSNADLTNANLTDVDLNVAHLENTRLPQST